jgi:hypothetical protein
VVGASVSQPKITTGTASKKGRALMRLPYFYIALQ